MYAWRFCYLSPAQTHRLFIYFLIFKKRQQVKKIENKNVLTFRARRSVVGVMFFHAVRDDRREQIRIVDAVFSCAKYYVHDDRHQTRDCKSQNYIVHVTDPVQINVSVVGNECPKTNRNTVNIVKYFQVRLG